MLQDSEAVEVPVLTLEELTAGKCAALLTRTAPRDAFDVWQLLESTPDLLKRAALRIAFAVQAGSAREDLRAKASEDLALTPKAVRQELLPLLRVEAQPYDDDPERLAKKLTQVRQRVAAALLAWRKTEREFLDRLIDRGEVDPGLLTSDPKLRERIAAQPMLRWKAIHVRRHRGLPPLEPEEV